MKFRIEAVSCIRYDDVEECEEVLKEYPCLKDFGYEVKEIEYPGGRKFHQVFVCLDSLEQLLELGRQVGEELIMDVHVKNKPRIKIYDGFIE